MRLFVATVESVLLYGAETWTMIKPLKKQMGVTQKCSGCGWTSHTSNAEIYGDLPKVISKVQQRMRLAGHCIRYDDQVASKFVLWQPSERRKIRVGEEEDTLLEDSTMKTIQEMKIIMVNCAEWKNCANALRRSEGRFSLVMLTDKKSKTVKI